MSNSPVRYFTHIYNRGVDKRRIFMSDQHRERFLLTLRLSRLIHAPSPCILEDLLKTGKVLPEHLKYAEKVFGPPLVDIIAVCQMDNHFHLIVGEKHDDRLAMAKFMQRVGTAFTKYFNQTQERTGRLFEAQYHHVDIIHGEQLIYTVRYVHINPTGKKSSLWNEDNIASYPWSSLGAYLEPGSIPWINTQPVMEILGDKNKFWEFTKDGITLPNSSRLEKDLRLE